MCEHKFMRHSPKITSRNYKNELRNKKEFKKIAANLPYTKHKHKLLYDVPRTRLIIY